MGLSLREISFLNLRNYPSFGIDGIGDLTIIVGRNAVGKTNIIEGIQLVTSLSSLRGATAGQLIAWGEKSLMVSVKEEDEARSLEVVLKISEGKREYRLNGKPKRPKDIRGLLPSVVFTPDDLTLIKGAQSIKRNTLDALGEQVHANYHTVKKDYDKLIRYKNLLLKEDPNPALLQSVNDLLVITGTQLQGYRRALLRKMAPHIQEIYEGITEGKEDLACSYVPFWESYDEERPYFLDFRKEESQLHYSRELEKRAKEEKARKLSTVGPHADKIDFFIDGKNAGIYASQGQQRSLVLAYKLAEVATIEEMTRCRPILLLDDVMSELDSQRRKALLNRLSGQTFITTTTLDYFPEQTIEHAKIVRLPLPYGEGGQRLSPVESKGTQKP